MPIFSVKEDIKVNVEETKVDNTRIMETDEPNTIILNQIGGYKWKVNYFNLITNITDYQSDFDLSLDLPITEYNEIKDLIIFLNSPLDNSKPDDITGEGIILLSVLPKLGDLFIANLMDGRKGLFILTGVTRGVYNNRDVYKINFKLYYIIDNTNIEIVKRLKEKTVNSFYYNDRYGIENNQQIYTTEQYVDVNFFKAELSNLISFFNRRMILPTNYNIIGYKTLNGIIYDPNLEYFIKRVIGVSNLKRDVYLYDLDKQISILDYMIDDSIMIEEIKRYRNLKFVTEYGNNVYLKPIRYSPVNWVVKLENVYNTPEIDENFENNENEYYPPLNKKSYIFSEDFYDVLFGIKVIEDTNLTLFENVILKLIDKEPIDKNDILTLIRSKEDLSVVQQLYFIPILYFIIKYYLNSFTTVSIGE